MYRKIHFFSTLSFEKYNNYDTKQIFAPLSTKLLPWVTLLK